MDDTITDEIQQRLTPFTRKFSPLLYFLIKELKIRHQDFPDETYTIREICESLEIPYPNQYMSTYLRLLHQSEYIRIKLTNNDYNRYRFQPSDKIQELMLGE